MRSAGVETLSKEMRSSGSRLRRAGGVHGVGSRGSSLPLFLGRVWGLMTT